MGEPIVWIERDSSAGAIHVRQDDVADAKARLRAVVESWNVPRGGSVRRGTLIADARWIAVEIVFDVPGVGRAWLRYRASEILVRETPPVILERFQHDAFDDRVKLLLREKAGISTREYKAAFVAWLKGRATPEHVALLDRVHASAAEDLGLPALKCCCGKPVMSSVFAPGRMPSFGDLLCDDCRAKAPEPPKAVEPGPKQETWLDRMRRDPTCTEPAR